MAMNRKEKEYVAGLKLQLALRETPRVEPDVPIPKSDYISYGWWPCGIDRVEPACSSMINHTIGESAKTGKTRSQGPKELYSTKLLALKAMRNSYERSCAVGLRAIDIKIEEEENNKHGND